MIFSTMPNHQYAGSPAFKNVLLLYCIAVPIFLNGLSGAWRCSFQMSPLSNKMYPLLHKVNAEGRLTAGCYVTFIRLIVSYGVIVLYCILHKMNS